MEPGTTVLKPGCAPSATDVDPYSRASGRMIRSSLDACYVYAADALVRLRVDGDDFR